MLRWACVGVFLATAALRSCLRVQVCTQVANRNHYVLFGIECNVVAAAIVKVTPARARLRHHPVVQGLLLPDPGDAGEGEDKQGSRYQHDTEYPVTTCKPPELGGYHEHGEATCHSTTEGKSRSGQED